MSLQYLRLNFRTACSNQLENSVIVTGGYTRSTDASHGRVQEYNLQGSVARLPDLNTARRNHACGHYVHRGQAVYVVTGGGYAGPHRLVSTEILTPGTSQWQFTGELPSPRNSFRGATIDGNFLVTG